ncbi:MAG TPA: hypothetical protein VI636_03155 [Candidatus Angelobacter sp.]
MDVTKVDLSKLNFGETVTALQKEKARLLEEKDRIERQIEVINQTIEGFIFLGNPESKMPLPRSLNEMGLQDAVRAVFRRAYPIPLRAVEVRDTLRSAGVQPPSTYKNWLISIHKTIERLADELEEVAQPGEKIAYRCKIEQQPK